MQDNPSHPIPLADLERLTKNIPFFSQILRNDEHQFNQLLNRASVRSIDASDEVIQAGAADAELYFLLKGNLEVLGHDAVFGERVINTISAGEVFGTLAMLLDGPRTATIKAPANAKETLVLGLSYTLFNDFEDFSGFTFETKLAFFQMLVHQLRWTVEMKKASTPEHELVDEIRKLPLFRGEKNSQEELAALKEQAEALAQLLSRWNEATTT